MILFSPLVALVPFQATAPVLILVGFLMTSIIRDIDFLDFEEGFPALLGLILMPLTFSITVGIGAGVRHLRLHQGRPGQVPRSSSADVVGRSRVRRLLRPGSDPVGLAKVTA